MSEFLCHEAADDLYSVSYPIAVILSVSVLSSETNNENISKQQRALRDPRPIPHAFSHLQASCGSTHPS